MIEVQELTKLYGDFPAVTSISFDVQPGEVVGLVGPNGAGKTTTLRSIVGIIRPTSGRIRIAGHDLHDDPLPAKQQLAFVPDEPQLFDYLTVDEHLMFVARIYNVEGFEARAELLLDELELRDKRGAFPDELSRGMKQNLAIACALDPGAIRRMKQTIRSRADAGAAVILSSHLLQLVEELCTRIVVIQSGRVVAHGAIREIAASRPELEGRGLEELFLAITEQRA